LVAAISLYLVLPTLLSVLGSWRSLSHLEWFFAVPVFASEAASYVCLWQLDRIALGTRGWFAVACAQLAGNAVGRFVPGAPTPFTVEMLRRAGVDTGEAAAAFTASTSLQLATTAALRCWRCRRDPRRDAGQPQASSGCCDTSRQPLQAGDRQRTVRLGEHGQHPHPQHLHQAPGP
jgi:hypothetical protein